MRGMNNLEDAFAGKQQATREERRCNLQPITCFTPCPLSPIRLNDWPPNFQVPTRSSAELQEYISFSF
jgi:hypothetical protein